MNGKVGGRRRQVEKRDRFASIAIDRSRGARSVAIAIATYPLLTAVRARTAAGNRINIQTRQDEEQEEDGEGKGEDEDDEDDDEEEEKEEEKRAPDVAAGGT